MKQDIAEIVESRPMWQRRYLMVENGTNAPLATTDDLGVRVPEGCRLIDTLGEDGLGPGISDTIAKLHFRSRAALLAHSHPEKQA